jgi:hypothetical protein
VGSAGTNPTGDSADLGAARLLYVVLVEALPEQFQMTHVQRLSETLDIKRFRSCCSRR